MKARILFCMPFLGFSEANSVESPRVEKVPQPKAVRPRRRGAGRYRACARARARARPHEQRPQPPEALTHVERRKGGYRARAGRPAERPAAMWDWEIREWERNRPPIPSKGPIPLECFRTVSDLLQHTYELEQTYMASLEAEACRVTPATERFKRGDRLPRNIEEEIQRENEREHAARRREIEHLEEAEVDINDVLKRPQGAQGALAGTCATRGGPAMMVDPLPDEEHELPGKSPAERARDLRKRGKVLASRGELIKACACYDAALALPTDEVPARERAVVLVNRSVALKRRGRLEDALDDARAAACADAHTAAKAHVTAAEAERSMGRFWAAARSCEAAAAAADSVGAKAPDETEVRARNFAPFRVLLRFPPPCAPVRALVRTRMACADCDNPRGHGRIQLAVRRRPSVCSVRRRRRAWSRGCASSSGRRSRRVATAMRRRRRRRSQRLATSKASSACLARPVRRSRDCWRRRRQ